MAADGWFRSSDSGLTEVWINEMSQSAINPLAGPYLGANSLTNLIESSSDRYKVQVVDEEEVADSDCYLIEVRLLKEYASFYMSHVRVWVDKETFFALWVEVYDGKDQLRSKQETLQITYEPPTDDALFHLPSHQTLSESLEMGEVIEDASPLKINFASNQANYRQGDWVKFQITIENTASKPIRLGKEPPK